MKHDLFVDKMKKRVSFATVEIGTLMILNQSVSLSYRCRLLMTFANSFDPDQARQYVGPDLNPNRLTLI